MRHTSSGGDSFEELLRKHSAQYTPTPEAGNWAAIQARMRHRQAPERRRFMLRSALMILLAVVARYGLLNLNTTFDHLHGHTRPPALAQTNDRPSVHPPAGAPHGDASAELQTQHRAEPGIRVPGRVLPDVQAERQEPPAKRHAPAMAGRHKTPQQQAGVKPQGAGNPAVKTRMQSKKPQVPAVPVDPSSTATSENGHHNGSPASRQLPSKNRNSGPQSECPQFVEKIGLSRISRLTSAVKPEKLKGHQLDPLHDLRSWDEFRELLRPRSWDLYVYGGMGRAQVRSTLARTYEVTTYQGDVMVKPDAHYANYNRQMARMEVGRYGAQCGYRLGSTGWKLYTGFDYQHIQRHLIYYHNQSPRNESVAFLDYRSHQAHGYEVTQKQRVNEYEFLSLPVAMGYQFKMDDKVNFDLSLGMAYQSLLSARTMEYNFYSEEFRQENEQSKQVYNDHQIHGQMALRATYDFGHYFSLRGGLQYQRSFTSIYDRSYPINLKVDQLSFDIGLVRPL